MISSLAENHSMTTNRINMKKIIETSLLTLALAWSQTAFANPFEAGINRMNSALQENGVANPNVSLGIKFNIPIEHPTDWNAGFYMPRAPSSLCTKPSDSSFSYENRANPCSVNLDSNNSSNPFSTNK